jgi:hypothetical protein
MIHPVHWQAATPLWKPLLEARDTARFHTPALLRFDRDDFMDEIERRLATGTPDFQPLTARAETWRTAAEWDDLPLPGAAEPVKLFQPAHQRFYLVAATLVCRAYGLPDRRIEGGEEESTSFVLRRVAVGPDGAALGEQHADYREHGWHGDEGWKPLDDPTRAGAGEERLPLFPLHYSPTGAPHPRRLLAGLIPVGKREAYEAAPVAGAALTQDQRDDDLGDARRTVFEGSVVQALTALREGLDAMDAGRGNITRTDARDVVVFALLDLAEFLEAHLPEVWSGFWDAVADAPRSPPAWTGSDAAQQAVFNQLQANFFGGRSWGQAAAAVYALRATALAGDLDDVLDPATGLPANLLALRTAIHSLNGLADLVTTALSATEPLAPGALPTTPVPVEPLPGSVYVVRCLYERPHCARPGGGQLVSARSQPFRLASFFDPDAPARRVLINLPIDTSVRGFRQSARGISMVFSSQLRNQMERVRGITLEALDEGDVRPPGSWTIGMICSFSLPIITLCALILLMIIIQLLNIVFWWLPFFRICFPIPVRTEGS